MTDQCSSCGGFCGKRCLRENVKPTPKVGFGTPGRNITVPRALLEQALDALQAHADIGINAEKAIAALRSALEQPQREDPDLLAAYMYGFEKGKDKTWKERKCKQCGDVLMSAFTQLCYGCQQEGMQ